MGINLSKEAINPSSCFSDLPESIIVEIISALPIKSILRCRSICKNWFHLISSSYFNNTLLKKRSALTFILRRPCGEFFLFEFQNRTSLTKTCYPIKPLKLNSKFGVPFSDSLDVVGHCNGLICLLDSLSYFHLIHIWNPVLGQFITFPIGELKEISLGYGFGYSRRTDQYKVVRIIKKETFFWIEVLTLGPNTWKRVENAHFRPDGRFRFCHFNEIVHWICDDDSRSEWICSFNISTEQQGFISPPSDCTDCRPGRPNLVLTVVRDCFCVLNCTYKGFVLWSMRDYGVAESWIKHVFVEFPESFGLKFIRFVTRMWDDEEYLFLDNYGYFGYFDSKEMQYVELKTTINVRPRVRTATFRYFPSFVPLFEVFKEEPSKMLIAQKGCFHLMLSFLRSYIHK